MLANKIFPNRTPLLKATGGTETTYGTYKVHTFTADGTFTVVRPNTVVDYIIIAGGGAGGSWHAGGGGAGGVRLGTNLAVGVTAFTLVVGDGGAGAASGTPQDGDDSSMVGSGLSIITATGGGAGGQYSGIPPSDGGSGAGGNGDSASNNYTGADGIEDGGAFGTATHQGNDGGDGVAGHAGGGGGGAGEAGDAAGAINAAGDGGDGINAFWGMSTADTKLLLDSAGIGEVSGSFRYVAGGGGGGVWSGTPGDGGLGTSSGSPRSKGSYSGNGGPPVAVSDYMGAGGSGAGSQGGTTSYQTQTTGGSGVIIIRYSKF